MHRSQPKTNIHSTCHEWGDVSDFLYVWNANSGRLAGALISAAPCEKSRVKSRSDYACAQCEGPLRELTSQELLGEAAYGRERGEVELSEVYVAVAGLGRYLFTRSAPWWLVSTADNHTRPFTDTYTVSQTRSSAIAEGPRDASCQLKSCQLPRNSAETTCTTSPEPSITCR